ncbi:hypothetical protein PoB_000976800 [Plakobranchus ocellatus]|uniref:Uncharacterized protein n=1 Tax=Plakobranchus ocellatus TaxID=259542 RepID=A0AAV3YLN4_9GAST|nr:hypothetical protein PoB_000976800 [Plakobranchus ocellatus]
MRSSGSSQGKSQSSSQGSYLEEEEEQDEEIPKRVSLRQMKVLPEGAIVIMPLDYSRHSFYSLVFYMKYIHRPENSVCVSRFIVFTGLVMDFMIDVLFLNMVTVILIFLIIIIIIIIIIIFPIIIIIIIIVVVVVVIIIIIIIIKIISSSKTVFLISCHFVPLCPPNIR